MSKPGRILIVEDNETERRAISQILKSEGFTVFASEDADRALSYVEEGVNVVISDVRLGDVSGMDLLALWKARNPESHFILLTGYSSVNDAIRAMKAGAYDYLTKPVNADELISVVHRAMESMRKDDGADDGVRRVEQKVGLERIIGQSKPMRDVFARVQRAAPVDSRVLILGESGTGKELIAQAVHHNSPRRKGPFVAVNIAAVPATLVESELFGHVRGAFTGATDRRMGRFEQADGGTLFIDEVGDFELPLQAKLLRALQSMTVTPVGGHEDRKVNVRVVSATSRDIQRMVRDGTFREDLYYRLNVVTIALPPLRQRPDDVPLLVEHFLKEISETRHTPARRMTPEVMQALTNYSWPGNVRQLENVLESMMVLAEDEVLTEKDLPAEVLAGPSKDFGGTSSSVEIPDLPIGDLERIAIFRALEKSSGNRTHAATRLGISVRTLQRKLKDYELAGIIASADADILAPT